MYNLKGTVFDKDTPNVIRVSRVIMTAILSLILMMYGMMLSL